MAERIEEKTDMQDFDGGPPMPRGTRETVNEICARADLTLPDGPLDRARLGAFLLANVFGFAVIIGALYLALTELFR